MTKYFTETDTWSGGYYELAIELGSLLSSPSLKMANLAYTYGNFSLQLMSNRLTSV